MVREKFRLKKDEKFVTVTDTDCMYPFLDVLWSQFFAFFSILIENNDDPEYLGFMIETSNIMIKLADTYSMNNQRDAFIFMFVQFGGLELLSNKELCTKN